MWTGLIWFRTSFSKWSFDFRRSLWDSHLQDPACAILWLCTDVVAQSITWLKFGILTFFMKSGAYRAAGKRWIFFREKIDGTVKLNVHFHILPRLRMLRTIVGCVRLTLIDKSLYLTPWRITFMRIMCDVSFPPQSKLSVKIRFFWGLQQAVYIRKFSIFVLSSKINNF